jgi:excisionase family DNA binding protein
VRGTHRRHRYTNGLWRFRSGAGGNESSELTTKQAAEVVGVSRPFLIRVLEAGEIPYRKVGRHRRVLMKDVLAYKEKMQVKSRAAMDELVKLSEEMGGYDL